MNAIKGVVRAMSALRPLLGRPVEVIALDVTPAYPNELTRPIGHISVPRLIPPEQQPSPR